jgi:catechol 2,3-dioxygenase-like lactoylglutathione lyase family enzyme
MPLMYMEHFLLQTEDIEATKDWYVNVLGFRVGPSPDFKFPVYWLYLGDRDVLHITTGGKNVSENRKKYVGQQSEATVGTGVIDHIGFRTTCLLEMIDHLKKHNVEFKERQVDDQGLYQLFLFDPNGVKIELNFANSEAKGRKPELSAKDLQPATN